MKTTLFVLGSLWLVVACGKENHSQVERGSLSTLTSPELLPPPGRETRPAVIQRGSFRVHKR